MSMRKFLWLAVIGAAMAAAATAAAAEVAVDEATEGPWHGSFQCYPAAVIIVNGAGARSAQFDFVTTKRFGTATTNLEQIGKFNLSVLFSAAHTAKLSIEAQSGESNWAPLILTSEVALNDNAVQWVGRWENSTCNLALTKGTRPAAFEVTAPNDPEGKSAMGSSLRGQALISAPNDPELRAAPETTTAQRDAPTASPATGSRDSVAVEVTFWDSVKDAHDAEELRAYLRRYPEGAFVDLARIRLSHLETK